MGKEIKETLDKNESFKDRFSQALNNEVCIFTKRSEMSFTGFSVIFLDG